jgi:predicted Zn-ribbon and HTH transcriptional regulator
LNRDGQIRRVINQQQIPKKKMKDLPRQENEDEENYLNDNNCIICYNEINEESFVTDLPVCHHKYHHECISKWFEVNSKCPLCKTDYIGQFDNMGNNRQEEDIVDVEPLIVRME